jgi:hypothetical protein
MRPTESQAVSKELNTPAVSIFSQKRFHTVGASDGESKQLFLSAS